MTNRYDSPYMYMMAPALRRKMKIRITLIKICASVLGAAAIISAFLIAMTDGLKIKLPFLDTPVINIGYVQTYNSKNTNPMLYNHKLREMYTHLPNIDDLSKESNGISSDNEKTDNPPSDNTSTRVPPDVTEQQNGAISNVDTSENTEIESAATTDEPTNTSENTEDSVPETSVGGTILSTDLSGSPSEGEILIRNETPYQIDIDALKNTFDTSLLAGATTDSNHTVSSNYDNENDATIYMSNSNHDPVVLIVHTHGTECYNTDGKESYTEEESRFRTHDTEKNLVSVGEAAAYALAQNGVTTLHSRVMHDAESYNNSYYYEAETIKKFLQMYPSIRFVIDMHRDAILYSDNVAARPITQTEKGDAAQLMFVVGSDYLGANHPNWQKNLALAILLQSGMNTSYPVSYTI